MNINKISIGLLFLTLALVIVPEASAKPQFQPASNGLHISEAAPGCAGECHNMPVFCARCHKYPYETLSPTATPDVTGTSVQTAIPAVTTAATTKTQTTPGFGIVASIIGLFALALCKAE